ncbi:MAG: type II toxin-antitoxin system VapC family toxin [Coriobacteriales bacterium]|jgi:predicted nucleic acid-binding protein|nr:type II toxin-antitoxin system VapC family toxin [Coriobacteriales bacterium]
MMIVLDTTIISEPLSKQSDENVIAWLLQNQENLYTTAVTIRELLQNIYQLPPGKRRENLSAAVQHIVSAYKERVLPYEAEAAALHARIMSHAYSVGHQLSVEDGMIAAVCSVQGGSLATRNTKDFKKLGINLELIDPFSEPAPNVITVDMPMEPQVGL